MTSRSTDPETSKEAGALATTPAKLRASHALVLRVFEAYGSMNDKDLIECVHAVEKNLGLKKLMSPSGIRSRRSELAKPNMDQLASLRLDWYKTQNTMVGDMVVGRGSIALMEKYEREGEITREDHQLADVWARQSLRVLGFPSRLWDTGKREVVDGRSVIVWGLAT